MKRFFYIHCMVWKVTCRDISLFHLMGSFIYLETVLLEIKIAIAGVLFFYVTKWCVSKVLYSVFSFSFPLFLISFPTAISLPPPPAPYYLLSIHPWTTTRQKKNIKRIEFDLGVGGNEPRLLNFNSLNFLGIKLR